MSLQDVKDKLTELGFDHNRLNFMNQEQVFDMIDNVAREFEGSDLDKMLDAPDVKGKYEN